MGYPPQPGPGPGVMYAGFGKRFGAYLIDILILIIPVFIILTITVFGAIAQVVNSNGTISTTTPSSVYVGSLVIAAMLFAYFGLLVGTMGSTLGQKILGIQVVSQGTMQKLPLPQAILRSTVFWVGSLVGIAVSGLGTVFSLLFLLSCLWCLWDPNKQTLHDKLGKALVITQSQVMYVPVPAAYAPQGPAGFPPQAPPGSYPPPPGPPPVG